VGDRAGTRAPYHSADEILRHLAEAVLVVEADATIAYANPKAVALLGLPAGRAAGRSVRDYVERAQSGDLDAVLAGTAPAGSIEVVLKRADGSLSPALLRLSSLPAGDRPSAVIMAITDLTERQGLQVQLERAQRLESLGTLAVGIAHDFNNSLTTILGYTQLAVSGLATQPSAAVEHLNVAIGEVRRAADLVRQLLSFGRRSYGQTQVVNLAELVREHVRTIGRTLPEAITVTTRLPDAPALTLADPTQVQQVLVNLVVNARDAMPSGGTLTIGLEEVDARTPPSADVIGVRPGRYYALTVSDTGLGIPAEIIDRIFDPFYSTKSPEQGSGLGLSVVWGIIHQQGGHVTVRSAPGQGTTFTVYWPVFEDHHPSDPPCPRGFASSYPGGR
jgi:PAS domain S-box-containing protein